jgi:hypothetical protein
VIFQGRGGRSAALKCKADWAQSLGGALRKPLVVIRKDIAPTINIGSVEKTKLLAVTELKRVKA